jgi:hypothetical protein
MEDAGEAPLFGRMIELSGSGYGGALKGPPSSGREGAMEYSPPSPPVLCALSARSGLHESEEGRRVVQRVFSSVCCRACCCLSVCCS